MLSYLGKESKCNAILGPFSCNPFSTGLKISPLNTVPKKDTSERRVILDLSFPKGSAVNDFINKDEYLGEKTDLVYPKVDDFIELIKAKGRGCLLYKLDLGKFLYAQASLTSFRSFGRNIYSAIQFCLWELDPQLTVVKE